MPNKERKLKIVPKHFPRVWKDAVFPEIRLAGKWLQDLGFKCGNFVIITQGESSITITALPEVKAEPKPVKKNTHKAKPIFSPELDIIPGNQLFSVLPAEVYREYVAKIKQEKIKKKEGKTAREWNAFKATLKASAPPEAPATPQNEMIPARNDISIFSPELESLSTDQLYRLLPPEDYRAYLKKTKEQQQRRRKVMNGRDWEAYKKERLSKGSSNFQTPPSQAAEGI